MWNCIWRQLFYKSLQNVTKRFVETYEKKAIIITLYIKGRDPEEESLSKASINQIQILLKKYVD